MKIYNKLVNKVNGNINQQKVIKTDEENDIIEIVDYRLHKKIRILDYQAELRQLWNDSNLTYTEFGHRNGRDWSIYDKTSSMTKIEPAKEEKRSRGRPKKNKEGIQN